MPYDDFEEQDHVASDDLLEVLEYTRRFHEAEEGSGTSQIIASSSKQPQLSANVDRQNQRSAAMEQRIFVLATEIMACQADINEITHKMKQHMAEKRALEQHLRQSKIRPSQAKTGHSKSRGINYATERFDWEEGLTMKMKKVFNINNFRLCQKGACNANMDGRDIVCIMPTGGGKSLTYQLPALLTPGCTLVISPLISLMTDQILHLRENKIEAVMITSSTSKREKDSINMRLHQLADRSSASNESEIKLCYVTPEKLSKDTSFKSLLQKLAAANKFARIVIDEAHCVSQLGHDFRPDYQKLRELRQLYPRVPIMALSATCGPQVLLDLVKILSLRPIVDGTDANADGTVYFSAPLYRRNLHYSVVAKPDKAADHLELMKNYILEHHPNDTGIIYCFTVNDTETVAQKLNDISNGRIKTGIYHARVPDAEKQRLHEQWRAGVIKVVCATIAFGLGIDKGDVRFVLHHSISKSLEGFYQESGRAGRDGKDSDCVLYYRPQDFSSIASVTSSEQDGETKLHAMLNFAEDLTQCRKIQFAEYFSHSSQLSISSWTTEDTDALQRCGHCDNCRRAPETVECKDVTLETWQILKIVEHIRQTGGKLTLVQLASLARGLKGGSYEASHGKRSKTKEKLTLDIDEVAGGPVDLNRNDIEHLLIRLLTDHYLAEEYVVTSYTRIIYLKPGRLAPTIIRHTRESVKDDQRRKIEFVFPKHVATAKAKRAARSAEDGSTIPKKRKQATMKGKEKAVVDSEDDMFEDDSFVVEKAQKESYTKTLEQYDALIADGDFGITSSEDDEYTGGWIHSMRDEPPVKRPRPFKKKPPIRQPSVNYSLIQEGDNEVMVLSSD